MTYFGNSDEISDLSYRAEEVAEQIFSRRYGKHHDIAEELRQIAERLDELATEHVKISNEQEATK